MQEPDDEIYALVCRLCDTQERLQELAGGEVDSVAYPGAQPYLFLAAQEKLRRSEAVQRGFAATQSSILNALPAHIALIDGRGVILSVNEGWRSFADDNELPSGNSGVGKNYLQICEQAQGPCAEEAHAAAAGIRAVLAKEVPHFSLEYPCHAATEKRWFRLMVSPMEGGGPGGAVVMHVDVTARKLAEEGLQESETLFRETFEQAAVGIAHISLDGRYMRVNDKLCRITGYTREELLDMTFVDLTVPEELAAGLEGRRAMLAGEIASFNTEKRYLRKDGKTVWVNLVSNVERTEDGKPKYVISVSADITSRKLAEFRLHRLNRLHTVLSKIGEVIVRTRDRQELYEALCRTLVEDGRLRLAFVADVDLATQRARAITSWGKDQGYLQDLTITMDGGPLSRGTVGMVLATGLRDICNDIANEPRMDPWRERMWQHGFHAAAAFPLKLGEATVAALSLYADEVGYFLEDEINLMASVAQNVSFALESLEKEEQRLRTESALRQSEERFRGLFAAAATGIAVSTSEGRYLETNGAYCRMLGYSAEELRALDFAALTHPEDIDLNLEMRDDLLAGQRESLIMEKRYMRKNGTVLWTRASVSAVRAPGGEVEAMILVAEDITAQKVATEELQRNAALLGMAGRVARLGGWSVELQSMAVTLSEETRRIHEMPPDFVPSLETALDFYPPEFRTTITQAMENCLQNGVPFDLELQILTTRGRRTWVRTIGEAQREADGAIRRIHGAFQDISERKRTEAVVHQQQKELRVLFDLIPAMVWFKNAENTFLRVNQKLAEATGMSVAEIEGRSAFEIYPQQAAAYYADDLEVIQLGVPKLGIVEKLRGSRDQEIWVRTDKVPYFDEDGQIIGIVGLSQDITEEKRVQESLLLFRSLMDQSTDAIQVIDPETLRFLDVSDSACVHLGYDRKELLSLSVFDIDPEISPSLQERIQKELQTPGFITFESRHRRKDGSTFPVEVNLKRVHFDKGYTVSLVRDITERKLAAAALEESQSRHRSLFENMLEGYAYCRLLYEEGQAVDYVYVEVNSAFEKQTGLKNVVGKKVSEIIAGIHETNPEQLEIYSRVAFNGRPEQFETHTRALGIWFSVSVYSLNDEHFISVFDNITKRKLAEIAVRQSEERLRLITDLVPHCIFAKDAEGRHIFANRTLAEVHGLSVEEIIGKTDFDLVADPVQAAAYRADDLAVIQSGKGIFRQEEPMTDFAGQKRFLQTTKIPFTVAETGEPAVVGVWMDITERKRMESRFRRLVDSNVQGIYFWNTQGQITEANDAFLNLTRYTREDADNGRMSWREMTPPEYADRDQYASQQIADSGVCTTYEKEFICKDGTRVPILIGAAIFDDNPEEGVCFTIDLTERRKIEQHFQRAQRMESIGTLAGGIAHDLNNALAPIILSLSVLQTRFPDRPSQELLGIIKSSAERGADMVRQVLAFARGVEGRRMELGVKHLLQEIEKIARDTFPKNIVVRTIVPHDLWTVLGDPTQIHQVLLNLCVNARDAMPEGGNLIMSAENLTLDAQYAGMNRDASPGPHVLIQVEDTGTGIPVDVIEKIFDPFFTTKELGKGTGLGLSTSLSIVKGHGGFVRVYSEPGKGTKFRIYFPAQSETGEGAAAEPQMELVRGRGELILVVDDESSVRDITKKTLEAFGYRVVLASDGAEAVAVYATHGVDIAAVLTDMMMPGIDGAATIQVLRRMNPKLPIIAASGLSTAEQIADNERLGVKHFLTKPYTAESLLNVLAEILSKRP